MKLFWYIERKVIAVLLLLLLALAPAMAQNVVYQGDTTPLAVEQKGADNYVWQFYSDSTVNFAVTPPDAAAYAEFVGGNTGAEVNVLWKEPGTYFFKVTARDATNFTMNLKKGKIKVNHCVSVFGGQKKRRGYLKTPREMALNVGSLCLSPHRQHENRGRPNCKHTLAACSNLAIQARDCASRVAAHRLFPKNGSVGKIAQHRAWRMGWQHGSRGGRRANGG